MRKHFLIDRLFEKDKMKLVYSHIDRIIAGGVCPADTELKLDGDQGAGSRFFPSNEGKWESSISDRQGIVLGGWEGICSGEKRNASMSAWVQKRSRSKARIRDHPAKFYFNSTPAHFAYPSVKLSMKDAQQPPVWARRKRPT